MKYASLVALGTLAALPAFAETEAELMAAAKREGKLVWVQPIDGGAQLSDEWAADFNKRTGLNIEIKASTTGNIPQVVSRVMQEFQAGRPSSTDIFVGAENHVVAFMNANALEVPDWSWATEVKKARVEEGGAAVQFMSRIPGLTYNAQKIKKADAPTTMAALVDTPFVLATTPYGANLVTYASPEIWGEEKTEAWVRKLAAKAKGFINCGQETRLLTGEFDVFGPDCGVSEAIVNMKKGAPLGYVIPSDAAIKAHFYVSIPKHAEHKAAAKLFINYLMSRPAQELMYKYNAADADGLPGSKTADEVATIEREGIRIKDIDVAFTRRNEAQANRVRGKFLGMLQAGRGTPSGGSGWGGGGGGPAR
jgi:ABC-type Fe3+ transport system substrate-binding protein